MRIDSYTPSCPPCPWPGNCYDADLAVASPLFRNITGREPGPNPTFQARRLIAAGAALLSS